MTTPLSLLLSRVRSSVAEITVDNMDDLTMFRDLQKAATYVAELTDSNATSDEIDTAVVCLGAYYAHQTYTLLSARQLGTIDEGVIIRSKELKNVARAMLTMVSGERIDSSLIVDQERYARLGGIAFATAPTILKHTP